MSSCWVRPAELKALDRWVGEWEMEVSVKPAAWLPQGSRSTFKATTRWTLNGRVLQCDANGEGTAGERKFKDAFMWLITYDPGARTYVSTVFWSNIPGNWGGGLRATATWDEQAGTLTTRAVDADSGVSSAGVTKWVDADTHEFTSTAKRSVMCLRVQGPTLVITRLSTGSRRTKCRRALR